MSIQDLGALGEFLAAIATLATLGYLALQIRQNTRAVQATSARETLFKFAEWHREILRDPELSRVFEKSCEVPMAEYTPEEWNKLNFLFKTFFHLVEAQYVHHRFQVGSMDQIEPHLRASRTVLSTWPAWKALWDEESRSGHWTEGFVEAINSGQAGTMTGFETTGKGVNVDA